MRVRIGFLLLFVLPTRLVSSGELIGTVIDAAGDKPIAARIYLQNAAGDWLFVSATAAGGSAVPYQEQWVPMADSVERHTTVSADPFRAELPAGEYQIAVERGKEYLPLRESIVIPTDDSVVARTFRLQRWGHAAERGWYSGETHVHRRLHELPNVMLAEDLNVAFPVTYWTTRSDVVPNLEPSSLRRQGPSPFGPREDRGYEPILIDRQHVIIPRNTEYEIFTVNGQSHVLGAIFVLNHRSPFQAYAPPVSVIAEQAHREGALLDLDKHSWPWSMMLVPVARVDLFELSNNSVWRTRFGFRSVAEPLPPWATFETDGTAVSAGTASLTEWGWLNYGFQVYYALLNCGFQIAPTAGTASGVHPVPLGHSRVYVHTGSEFDHETWLQGLKDGKSFVTNGPLVFATLNGSEPGGHLRFPAALPVEVALEIEFISRNRPEAVRIIVNGDEADVVIPDAELTTAGAWRCRVNRPLRISRTSWIAVCGVEQGDIGSGDGVRRSFAHTAPWYVHLGDQPVTPRRVQLEYFIGLMETQLDRNRDVLAPEALEEFQRALTMWRELLPGSE